MKKETKNVRTTAATSGALKAEETSRLREGDEVYWISSANGTSLKKSGVIVEVVKKGEKPKRRGVTGVPRAGESYLVEVPAPKTSRAASRIYWPRASLLRRRSEAETSEATDPLASGPAPAPGVESTMFVDPTLELSQKDLRKLVEDRARHIFERTPEYLDDWKDVEAWRDQAAELARGVLQLPNYDLPEGALDHARVVARHTPTGSRRFWGDPEEWRLSAAELAHLIVDNLKLITDPQRCAADPDDDENPMDSDDDDEAKS